MFDIKAVKQEAAKEIADEQMKKAKTMLVTQMRVVASAELVLAHEKRKLQDIEAAIAEGNLK